MDSCLKYYMDGIREFYIDTKSKKVHCGNVETKFYIVEYEYTDKKESSPSELIDYIEI